MKMLFQKLLILVVACRTSATALEAYRLHTRDGFQVDRYAALGDSFAVGPDAGDQYNKIRET
jgi:hypothetical protein